MYTSASTALTAASSALTAGYAHNL